MQSGLSLTTKGVKHQGGELWIGSANAPVTYFTITTSQVYLQVPLKTACQVPIGGEAELFVNAGPYIAYGIGGKETTEETTRPAGVLPLFFNKQGNQSSWLGSGRNARKVGVLDRA